MLSRDKLKAKHRMMPGTQSVTYTPRNRESASAVENVTAETPPVDKRALSVNGGLAIAGDQKVWILWDNTITGDYKPQQDDTITDSDGTVWVINACRLELQDTRWRCVCTKAPT
jgi:hypothetical protein